MSLWWLAVALVAALAGQPVIAQVTDAGDTAALLAFKAQLTDANNVLSSWSPGTDPCISQWLGVDCICTQGFLLTPACTGLASNATVSRVYGLLLSSMLVTQGSYISGALPAALGALTQLRYLVLSNQNFTGTIPPALSGLTELRMLGLGRNQLTGQLPAFLGTLPHLGSVWLGNNQFSGPVPQAWCDQGSNAAFTVHLESNERLCGPLPTCLEQRVMHLTDTGLRNVSNSSANPMGGSCSLLPPMCDLQAGCGFQLPNVWTNASNIEFNLTAFTASGGEPLQYSWGLGTQAGLTDVIPLTPVTSAPQTVYNATVQGANKVFPQLTLYQVKMELNSTSLLNAKSYYATVQAAFASPYRPTASMNSPEVMVDSSLPTLAGMTYNGPDCSQVSQQTDTDTLWGCWDAFTDSTGGMQFYAVQAFQTGRKSDAGNMSPISTLVNVGLRTSIVLSDLQLQVNKQYVLRISATDTAGITGFADTDPVKVVAQSHSLSPGLVAAIVAGTVAVSCGLAALLTVLITQRRFNKASRMRKTAKERAKQLRALLASLVPRAALGGPQAGPWGGGNYQQLRQLAFVVTDIEASTAQAAQNSAAYSLAQEIHDTVLREGIVAHEGYEINTEGDSFHIAFAHVHQAVAFAMETQARLLEAHWPAAVLKMPQCREVNSKEQEEPLFRGPRVRMGIHWASEGTVAQRLHPLTKHRVFTGPAFSQAVHLGDVASGGQVVISHEAWLQLRDHMPAAGFPVLRQLGLFQEDLSTQPFWVYEVRHLLGRQPVREFGPLRRVVKVQDGCEYSFGPPVRPSCRDSKAITFVAVRLVNNKAEFSHLAAWRQIAGRQSFGPSADMPVAVAEELYKVLASVALQFQGHMSDMDLLQGTYMVAFATARDAVRFCHAAQAAVLYRKWSSDGTAFFPQATMGTDGRPLLAGPALAMAVHESGHYSLQRDSQGPRLTSSQKGTYAGPGLAFVLALCSAVHGGQVVLSEPAWSAAQDQIPGLAQVISLGTHVISLEWPKPMMVFEVMPSVLAKRTFPPLATERMLVPGYRDSPDPGQDMAIVYIKVAKPHTVVCTEKTSSAATDDEVLATLTAYNLAVGKVSRTVRHLLPQHQGYECKEPEPGKFTLAFRDLTDAVQWACAAQLMLLQVAWPPAVLKWPECSEFMCPAKRCIIWRGLRVCMGIASGRPQYRKPLKTGRADYFGTLPNLAARLCALAHPGQVLVESKGVCLGHKSSKSGEGRFSREDSAAFLAATRKLSVKGGNGEAISLDSLGYFQIKGLADARHIYQACAEMLVGRRFAHLDAIMHTRPPVKRVRLAGAWDNVASLLGAASSGSQSPSRQRSGSQQGCKLGQVVARLGSSTERGRRSTERDSRWSKDFSVDEEVDVESGLHELPEYPTHQADGTLRQHPIRFTFRKRKAYGEPSPPQCAIEFSKLGSRGGLISPASELPAQTAPPDKPMHLEPLSRHGGEHHPHWGSIVGSVARGMRQVGLPLGRHHHTQHLDPERADAAAATRKQAMEFLSRTSAANKAQCAEIESLVRDSLRGPPDDKHKPLGTPRSSPPVSGRQLESHGGTLDQPQRPPRSLPPLKASPRAQQQPVGLGDMRPSSSSPPQSPHCGAGAEGLAADNLRSNSSPPAINGSEHVPLPPSLPPDQVVHITGIPLSAAVAEQEPAEQGMEDEAASQATSLPVPSAEPAGAPSSPVQDFSFGRPPCTPRGAPPWGAQMASPFSTTAQQAARALQLPEDEVTGASRAQRSPGMGRRASQLYSADLAGRDSVDAVSDSFAREVAQLFVVGRHSRQQGLEAGLGPLDGPAAVDLSPWSSAPSSRSGQGAGPSSDGISLRQEMAGLQPLHAAMARASLRRPVASPLFVEPQGGGVPMRRSFSAGILGPSPTSPAPDAGA